MGIAAPWFLFLFLDVLGDEAACDMVPGSWQMPCAQKGRLPCGTLLLPPQPLTRLRTSLDTMGDLQATGGMGPPKPLIPQRLDIIINDCGLTGHLGSSGFLSFLSVRKRKDPSGKTSKISLARVCPYFCSCESGRKKDTERDRAPNKKISLAYLSGYSAGMQGGSCYLGEPTCQLKATPRGHG